MRNYHFHGQFYPFSVQGGINFYIGNNPQSEGIIMEPQGIPTLPVTQVRKSIQLARYHTGQPLTAFQASDYWQNQGLRYLAEQPMDAISLYARKFFLFWRKEEITLNINYELSRDLLPLMKSIFLVSFGAVAPLAIAGLLFSLKHVRQYYLIIAYAGSYMLSVILFFISDRYRLPIAPFLCLFAALAIDTYILRWPSQARSYKWLALPVICLLAFVINFEFSPSTANEQNYQSIHYKQHGTGLQKQRRSACRPASTSKSDFPQSG